MSKLKKNIIGRDEGFVVPMLYLLFYFLERISVFYWIRVIAGHKKDKKSNKKDTEESKEKGKEGTTQGIPDKKPFVKTYLFSELWAVGNPLFAALISLPLLRTYRYEWVGWILGIYAGLRVMEMFVYQVNVLFFHRLNQYFWETEDKKKKKKNDEDKNINWLERVKKWFQGIRKWIEKRRQQKTEQHETVDPSTTNKANDTVPSDNYKIKSATRTVLLLLVNMGEYIIQFAVMYAALGVITGSTEPVIGIVKSFQLFMNISGIEGAATPQMVVAIRMETILGIFMNIVCLARFIGMLPSVRTIE